LGWLFLWLLVGREYSGKSIGALYVVMVLPDGFASYYPKLNSII